jgi:hypothetical protein
MSHAIFGRQVYYLDVCAFSEADTDLAMKLHAYHQGLLDSCIRKAGWQV